MWRPSQASQPKPTFRPTSPVASRGSPGRGMPGGCCDPWPPGMPSMNSEKGHNNKMPEANPLSRWDKATSQLLHVLVAPSPPSSCYPPPSHECGKAALGTSLPGCIFAPGTPSANAPAKFSEGVRSCWGEGCLSKNWRCFMFFHNLGIWCHLEP